MKDVKIISKAISLLQEKVDTLEFHRDLIFELLLEERAEISYHFNVFIITWQISRKEAEAILDLLAECEHLRIKSKNISLQEFSDRFYKQLERYKNVQNLCIQALEAVIKDNLFVSLANDLLSQASSK